MPIKLNLVTIDEARINDVQEMYFMWKELCLRIKSCSSRAVNFPETISEVVVCWVLGLKWNKGSNCDAVNEETGLKIEVKASSSSGPSSFSSRTPFDDLVFAKLDMKNDILHIYDTNLSSSKIENIKVNGNETYKDQQKDTRRPRFDVYKNIIQNMNINETASINMRNLKIEKY